MSRLIILLPVYIGKAPEKCLVSQLLCHFQIFSTVDTLWGTVIFDHVSAGDFFIDVYKRQQLYYTPPYTKGGIEKSHVVLAAFDKTDVLKPGESQTLTLSFMKEDMASYDYKDAKAYVLEKGDYAIKLMKNSHDVIDQRTYKVKETVVNRESDLVEATNQFCLLYTSRCV